MRDDNMMTIFARSWKKILLTFTSSLLNFKQISISWDLDHNVGLHLNCCSETSIGGLGASLWKWKAQTHHTFWKFFTLLAFVRLLHFCSKVGGNFCIFLIWYATTFISLLAVCVSFLEFQILWWKRSWSTLSNRSHAVPRGFFCFDRSFMFTIWTMVEFEWFMTIYGTCNRKCALSRKENYALFFRIC